MMRKIYQQGMLSGVVLGTGVGFALGRHGWLGIVTMAAGVALIALDRRRGYWG